MFCIDFIKSKEVFFSDLKLIQGKSLILSRNQLEVLSNKQDVSEILKDKLLILEDKDLFHKIVEQNNKKFKKAKIVNFKNIAKIINPKKWDVNLRLFVYQDIEDIKEEHPEEVLIKLI